MASKLSAEQKTTIQEVFSLFDHDDNNTIMLKEVPVALRTIGLHLEDDEMKDVMEDLESNIKPFKPDRNKSSTLPVVTFTYFSTIVESLVRDVDDERETREAFQAFDREGEGTLLAVELRHILTSLGDKLTEEEVDELLDEVDMDTQGRVDYVKLAKVITSKEIL